ncbi:vacuolar protein sorting-associated protein 16 homolog [Diaphorina citri]|uniref:Vacuolar protein sorting-associated protein 16 homolog n=1 Tax=Diaphorina citri TaxID=121845 RepID=A0A3Q0IP28_DIACI|nr:vacuolar protein sorting-associated protein 16 homolog [Diaphorina citri]
MHVLHALSVPRECRCSKHNNLINTVIGTTEDSLSYVYDYPVFLVSELDCVRVISADTHHIIQCVPEVVQEIFKINSLSPGSYLLEASKQFQKRNHRANEYIHIVKPNLTLAVAQCIEAAGHEFNPSHQKMLMTAAQYGKCFLHNFDSTNYVKMLRVLRLLNQVRDPQIGIAITYEQLNQLGIDKLIDMLILRRFYYLALQISKYLRLSSAEGSVRILSHWAYYKVKQPVVDKNRVAKEIHDKIGQTPGISYTDIANEAANHMNVQLAIRLLDYEPCATKQVPHLLKLRQEREALVKAIESGNTDLVYTVILTMKANMHLSKFEMEIRNYPMAQALYIKYCKSHNKQALNAIYNQEDNFNSLAAWQIKEAYNPSEGTSKEACLLGAQENYKKAKNEFAATLCEEQIKLMKYQRQMEESLKFDFQGLTLHETLEKLLSLQKVKLADNLRTEYKVPDKRYWWLRIKALGQAEDWVGLDKFSKLKKSPIGYEPFIDVCLEFRNKFEAKKYLPKVREDMKVKYLVKLDMLDEALQSAILTKDVEGLDYIASKSQSSKHVEEANRLLAQFSGR